jgi:hypothetical protein
MAGTNLTVLRGVGAAKAKKIEDAGFKDVESLAGADLDTLVGAGFTKKVASTLIETAVKEVGEPTPPAEDEVSDAPTVDAKGSDARKSSGLSAPDTAPRHIGADKKRASMGVSLKSDKKSKEDDDTKRKAEFRRRWEGGANPSSMEEFRWVKEFLG